MNWELMMIFNQVSSRYNTKAIHRENYPPTWVSPYPVYYLKKTED